jgi:hypothetical protein
MKCKHSFVMLYVQYQASPKVDENKLKFRCSKCKFEKSISAKFLRREARHGRVYLLSWV